MKVYRIPKASIFKWKVSSKSEKGTFHLVEWNGEWICDCIGFLTHKKECRHIRILRNRFKGLNYETENY